MPEYQGPGREGVRRPPRKKKGETLRLRAAGVNRGGYAKAAAPVLCQAKLQCRSGIMTTQPIEPTAAESIEPVLLPFQDRLEAARLLAKRLAGCRTDSP